jgi:hypothetical protein
VARPTCQWHRLPCPALPGCDPAPPLTCCGRRPPPPLRHAPNLLPPSLHSALGHEPTEPTPHPPPHLWFKAASTIPHRPSSSRAPYHPKCTEDLHHPLPPPIELLPAPKAATHHRILTKMPPPSFSPVSAASTRTPCDLSRPHRRPPLIEPQEHPGDLGYRWSAAAVGRRHRAAGFATPPSPRSLGELPFP